MSCSALSLAVAALDGSEFARESFACRYGVPGSVWTADPLSEPEPLRPVDRTRLVVPTSGQRLHNCADVCTERAASRVAVAIEAIEDGDQATAVEILLALEADLWAAAA